MTAFSHFPGFSNSYNSRHIYSHKEHSLNCLSSSRLLLVEVLLNGKPEVRDRKACWGGTVNQHRTLPAEEGTRRQPQWRVGGRILLRGRHARTCLQGREAQEVSLRGWLSHLQGREAQEVGLRGWLSCLWGREARRSAPIPGLQAEAPRGVSSAAPQPQPQPTPWAAHAWQTGPRIRVSEVLCLRAQQMDRVCCIKPESPLKLDPGKTGL